MQLDIRRCRNGEYSRHLKKEKRKKKGIRRLGNVEDKYRQQIAAF